MAETKDMKPSDAEQLESLLHDDLWRCGWIPSESQRSLLFTVIRAELARTPSAAPASVPDELVAMADKWEEGYSDAVNTIEEGFCELLAALGLDADEGDGMDAAPAWIISQVLKQIAEGLKPLQITRNDDLEYTASAYGREQAQQSSIDELMGVHSEMLESNAYCYFELAYTRQTEWMAWICSKPREDDPDRKVLAKGQGSTPEDACASALKSMQEAAK